MTTRVPLLITALTAALLSAGANGDEKPLELRGENSCPQTEVTPAQLFECLSKSFAVRHNWRDTLEVRFDIAVLNRGRVEELLESEAATARPKQWISLTELRPRDAFEIPGGDMFIPGGDTFIPGGDMFADNEEDYLERLAAYAEEYALTNEPIILVIARPRQTALLAALGYLVEGLRLEIAS